MACGLVANIVRVYTVQAYMATAYSFSADIVMASYVVMAFRFRKDSNHKIRATLLQEVVSPGFRIQTPHILGPRYTRSGRPPAVAHRLHS